METQIQLKHFLTNDWENLHETFFLQIQALATSSSSMPLPQHDLRVHKCVLRNFIFRCAKEYSQVTHVLAPFTPTPTFFDTTSILTALHLESNGHFPLFLKDCELDQDFKLSFNSFKLAFQRMLDLSVSGFSKMVFEHLRDYFHSKDSTNGFFQLF
jgi:hypothetical protein